MGAQLGHAGARRLRRVMLAVAWSLHLALNAPAAADPLSDWNEKAQVIAAEHCLSSSCRARTLALVHVAIFEAIDAAERGNPRGEASLEAAVATAAHDMLAALHPERATDLNPALAASLAAVANDVPKVRGFATGRKATAAVLSGLLRAQMARQSSGHVVGGLRDVTGP